MAEDTPPNGNGDPGFRVTLGAVYTQQLALSDAVKDLKAELRISRLEMENERRSRDKERELYVAEKKEQDVLIEKLNTKLNGFLTTLGMGLIAGIIAYLSGVL